MKDKLDVKIVPKEQQPWLEMKKKIDDDNAAMKRAIIMNDHLLLKVEEMIKKHDA